MVRLGHVRVSGCVHLEDEQLCPVLPCERLQVRGEGTARPAPRCPKIHKDGDTMFLRLMDYGA
jgi:hypothetical protein